MHKLFSEWWFFLKTGNAQLLLNMIEDVLSSGAVLPSRVAPMRPRGLENLLNLCEP